MKQLKMLGLAAIAACALTAFLGAGSAQATVLCSTTSTPCGANWHYSSGTEIHAVLKAGTHFTLTTAGNVITTTCTESTIRLTTTNTGGNTETVDGNINTLTFSRCTCNGGRVDDATTLSLGSLEFHHITGTSNATVTGKNTNVTFNCTGLGQCEYGTAAGGTDLGTLTGGNPAILVVNASLPRTGTTDGFSFTCPSPATVTAEYEVTTPKPLFVEPS